MKHDAILKNPKPYVFNYDKLIGYVFGDEKGRFKDGEHIITSTVKDWVPNKDDPTHAITKSGTVYKLVYGDLQDNKDVM